MASRPRGLGVDAPPGVRGGDAHQRRRLAGPALPPRPAAGQLEAAALRRLLRRGMGGGGGGDGEQPAGGAPPVGSGRGPGGGDQLRRGGVRHRPGAAALREGGQGVPGRPGAPVLLRQRPDQQRQRQGDRLRAGVQAQVPARSLGPAASARRPREEEPFLGRRPVLALAAPAGQVPEGTNPRLRPGAQGPARDRVAARRAPALLRGALRDIGRSGHRPLLVG